MVETRGIKFDDLLQVHQSVGNDDVVCVYVNNKVGLRMLRRLKSVISPMSAMRIEGEEPAAELQQKLHLITQYLINSAKQFDVWMELQSHIQLHYCLQQIFDKAKVSAQNDGTGMGSREEELAHIIQFYTMLIHNSKDQLLICKLVSDDFVLQMCRLENIHPTLASDVEAYRINLIRAYLSQINPESIKYMVIQDKFKVFQTCIQLFSAKLGLSTVEFTTLSNTILHVMGKVHSISYLWDNIWATQGLQLLYTQTFEHILELLKRESSQKQLCQLGQGESIKMPAGQSISSQSMESIEEIVLFLIQVRSSVNDTDKTLKIDSYCYLYLEELEQRIWAYPTETTKASVFAALFGLFKAYNFERELIEKVMQNHFNQILVSLSEFSTLHSSNPKINGVLLYKSVFMLNRIVVSKYSRMSERSLQQLELTPQECTRIEQLRIYTLQILIKIISNSVQLFESSTPSLFLQFIKYTTLTVFSLKIAINFNGEEETIKKIFSRLNEAVLELFLTYTFEIKKLMIKSELWDEVIKWYEEANNKVTHNLLILPDTLERKQENPAYCTLLTYEYLRNYRYMIVEHTSLDPKFIKQEKFYHSTFSSPGLSFEPGKTIGGNLCVICHCLFHHNYQQIPVVVIEDKQCLLIAMKMNETQFKTIINIKFKDVDGLVYGNSQTADARTNTELPRFVKINLRGCQQILLEFSNPKVVGNAFKDYLIKSRDNTRQRQLSFIHQWIKDYQSDSEKSLVKVKQELKKQENIVL